MQLDDDGVKSELWGVGKHQWNAPAFDSLPWYNYDEKTGVPIHLDTHTKLPSSSSSSSSYGTVRLPFDTPSWRAAHPRPDHVVAVHHLSVHHGNGSNVGVGVVQWLAHKVTSRANRVAMAGASGASNTKQQCFEMLATDYTRAMWNMMVPVYKLQRLTGQAIKLKFEETSFMGFTMANDAMWDAGIDQLYERVFKVLADFYTNFTDTIFRGVTSIGAGDFATAVATAVNLRLANHGEADQADERQLCDIGAANLQRRPQPPSPSPLPLLELSSPSPPPPPSPSSPSLSSLQQLSSPPAPSSSSLSYPTPTYVPPSAPWSSVTTISSPTSPQSPLSPMSPHHNF